MIIDAHLQGFKSETIEQYEKLGYTYLTERKMNHFDSETKYHDEIAKECKVKTQHIWGAFLSCGTMLYFEIPN